MNHRFPYWNCHHVNNFQIPSMIQTVRSIWKQILCSFPFVYLVNTRACLKMEDTNSITMFLENMVKNYNKRSKFGDTVWCKSLSCQILSTSSDLWIWEDPFGAAKDRSPRSPRSPRRIIQVSLTLHTTQAPDAVRSKTRNSLRNHLFVPCKKTGRADLDILFQKHWACFVGSFVKQEFRVGCVVQLEITELGRWTRDLQQRHSGTSAAKMLQAWFHSHLEVPGHQMQAKHRKIRPEGRITWVMLYVLTCFYIMFFCGWTWAINGECNTKLEINQN